VTNSLLCRLHIFPSLDGTDFNEGTCAVTKQRRSGFRITGIRRETTPKQNHSKPAKWFLSQFCV